MGVKTALRESPNEFCKGLRKRESRAPRRRNPDSPKPPANLRQSPTPTAFAVQTTLFHTPAPAANRLPYGFDAATKPLLPPTLRALTASHSSDSSHSIARRPSLRHASPVVPEPHIGSSTTSPSRVDIRIRGSITDSGFCAGCPVCSFFPTNPYIERRFYHARRTRHKPHLAGPQPLQLRVVQEILRVSLRVFGR